MIFRNVLKSFICILALMFFIPTMPVKAAESYGHENGKFSWSIIDDVMTLENVAGDWKITIKNDTYTIEGEKITTPLPEYEDDEPSTDNENEWFTWYIRHPVDRLVLKVKICSRSMAKDPCLSNITTLEIGEEAEIIDNNTFKGAENLKTVYVYSKNVELDNSGIGYSYFEDDVLEDLTIYGYSGSTAEAYANENGFTFIALDEPATTTTQVTTSTTTTTATTVTTSISIVTSLFQRAYHLDIHHLPNKTNYNIGDKLDLTGLTVDLRYNDESNIYYNTDYINTYPLDYPDVFIIDTSNFDNSKAGTYTIKISCKYEAIHWYPPSAYLKVTVNDSSLATTTTSTSSTVNTTTPTVTTTITAETNTEQTTAAVSTTTPTSTYGAESIVSTETSTVPTTVTAPAVITTETGTKLPQTGYSIWYQSLVAVAMGMVGIGSAVIVRSGVFRKKDSNG